VVVELDEFKTISPAMIDQLAELKQRIDERGGWLRLCGTRPKVQQSLESAGLGGEFPNHSCRAAAVSGVKAPHFELAEVARS
jgi:anti-anti-sigma regulatory factor